MALSQVRTVCLSDSSSRNSLSLEMLKTLVREIKRDEDNKDLRSIVLTSVPGKVFSAGHNLKELVRSALIFTKASRTEKKIIISLHRLDSRECQVSQGRIRDLFGVDAGDQSEPGAGDRGGGRFGSRSRLSIDRGLRHRRVHGKKFVLHSGVLSRSLFSVYRYIITISSRIVYHYLLFSYSIIECR